jgi:hypothetical protein
MQGIDASYDAIIELTAPLGVMFNRLLQGVRRETGQIPYSELGPLSAWRSPRFRWKPARDHFAPVGLRRLAGDVL